MASSIRPSSAPWRSSPVNRRIRKSCSGAVQRLISAESRVARRACEPEPLVAASSVRAASTSATSRVGVSAGCCSSWSSVRHPVPSRPCTGVPVRKPVTARISALSSRVPPPGSPVGSAAVRSAAARASTFARRERVAVTAAEAWTTSANITLPCCLHPRVGARGARRAPVRSPDQPSETPSDDGIKGRKRFRSSSLRTASLTWALTTCCVQRVDTGGWSSPPWYRHFGRT